MNDIMKIVQALEDFNILLKGVAKTIKNDTKEQKGGFLSMLLGTLRVLVQVVLRPLFRKNNGIFNAASSFNKL